MLNTGNWMPVTVLMALLTSPIVGLKRKIHANALTTIGSVNGNSGRNLRKLLPGMSVLARSHAYTAAIATAIAALTSPYSKVLTRRGHVPGDVNACTINEVVKACELIAGTKLPYTRKAIGRIKKTDMAKKKARGIFVATCSVATLLLCVI